MMEIYAIAHKQSIYAIAYKSKIYAIAYRAPSLSRVRVHVSVTVPGAAGTAFHAPQFDLPPEQLPTGNDFALMAAIESICFGQGSW